MKIKNRTLAEDIAELVTDHEGKSEATILRILTSGSEAKLCKVLEIGKDYLQVRDDSGKEVWFSLSAGIAHIRDVTGDPAFKYAGG